MRENEPENYAKIAKIMLPKDYINYILTGVHACDYSDASGMLLLDVQHKWLMEEIFHTKDYAAEQTPISEDKLGENHVFLRPYLMGERSPINDTNARGTFIGMTMDTTRADMVQAVLEGVAFAIRDSVEVARRLGMAD